MIITKYAHSCVLVEAPERVAIFDPGNHSWASRTFDPTSLKALDDIIISHEHLDHMYIPFIWALVDRFPKAQVTTTETAANTLREHGVTNVQVFGDTAIRLFQATHESGIPLSSPPPVNNGTHYLDQFTHPGDCQHINESRSVLALPLTGTWGTPAQAARLIEELRPDHVLPIHDWNWHEDARLRYYARFRELCERNGVNFLQPVDGRPIEIR